LSSSILAINSLEMTLNENEVFTVDFTSWIGKREKIIGVVSVTLTPAGNAPAISQIGYSTIGKHVSFRLDATGAGVVKTQYTLSIIVTTQYQSVINQKEAIATLFVR
jgi:hypothetical protein